jgi:hypothetical protein
MRRLLGAVLVTGALTITILPGVPVGAQGGGSASASPSASGSGAAASVVPASPGGSPGASEAPVALEQLCELWTPAAVSAALGGESMTIDASQAGPRSCRYAAEKASSPTELLAALAFGDASTGSLVDLVRANFQDAADVPLGDGVVALRTPSEALVGDAKGWTQSSMFVFPDPMVMLQLQTRTPKGVDGDAALVALVQQALPRLTAMAVPAPSASVPVPSTPAGSPGGAAGLHALFPTEVGGSPVTVQPPGIDLATADPAVVKKLSRQLGKQGRRVEELVWAVGQPASGSATIIAVQLPGGRIGPVVNDLIALLGMGDSKRTTKVAGKKVRLLEDRGYTPYDGYAKGDVLWLVHADGAERTEIFRQLP